MTPAMARERADYLIEMADLDAEQRALMGIPSAPSLSELRREAMHAEAKAIQDAHWHNVYLPFLRGLQTMTMTERIETSRWRQ